MEKFLIITRKTGANSNKPGSDNRAADHSILEEWIQRLRTSGNYFSGVPVAGGGQYVIRDEKVDSKSSGEANDGILRFDTIMAEDINQASVLAQTCPLVVRGLVEIEVRKIVPLVR
jgi:hypothetical protein